MPSVGTRRATALGWLIATRPVTGVVGVALALALLERRVALGVVRRGLVPGIALLLLYQRSATGSLLASTQLAYYASADGPPGCFRYGFGRGIGCLYEHGESTCALGERLRLPPSTRCHSAAALRSTASTSPTQRRSRYSVRWARGSHALTVECARCSSPVSASCSRIHCSTWMAATPVAARDSSPIYSRSSTCCSRSHWYASSGVPWHCRCHLLASPSTVLCASRSPSAMAATPCSSSTVLRRAGVGHGLVFVDTDHGFNLGHDPGHQLDAHTSVVVARYEHDARDDWLLWDRLGRPPSFHYSYDPCASVSHGELTPYLPSVGAAPRFEAEAEWPPLAVSGGWVQPDFVPCASNGRGLRLRPTSPTANTSLDFELAPPSDRSVRNLRLGWFSLPGPPTKLQLILG